MDSPIRTRSGGPSVPADVASTCRWSDRRWLEPSSGVVGLRRQAAGYSVKWLAGHSRQTDSAAGGWTQSIDRVGRVDVQRLFEPTSSGAELVFRRARTEKIDVRDVHDAVGQHGVVLVGVRSSLDHLNPSRPFRRRRRHLRRTGRSISVRMNRRTSATVHRDGADARRTQVVAGSNRRGVAPARLDMK